MDGDPLDTRGVQLRLAEDLRKNSVGSKILTTMGGENLGGQDPCDLGKEVTASRGGKWWRIDTKKRSDKKPQRVLPERHAGEGANQASF